jgi:hypothetical protein
MMNYVRLEDPAGCLIAAVAMVLDKTYAEVLDFIPLNTFADMQDGHNLLGDKIIEGLNTLLKSKGLKFCELLDGPPYTEAGTRYIALVFGGKDHLNHALAIAENGIAFDPLDESSRKPFDSYPDSQILSVVGIRRLAD